MRDVNVRSFTGPADNGRIVDESDAQIDASQEGRASAVKCTGQLRDFRGVWRKLIGGRDACADSNDLVSDVTITVEEATPTGQFVGVSKGGARNVHYIFKRIMAHGRVCDFIYDDYSDQSHLATKGNSLAARMDDGSPVVVYALKTKPSLVTAGGFGPYVFPWWQAFNWRVPFTENYYVVGFIFDTLRRWGWFRAAANS